MDKHYAWALTMTFFYSLIAFINKNSSPQLKENLKNKTHWIRALTAAVIDSGFAILFFSGIIHFKPDWPIALQVSLAVFAGVFLAETLVEKGKDIITKWKI